jgi:hypothetical protein
MSKRAKHGPSQCKLSPNHTSTVTTRDVLTPNGKNVTGRQLEVPTPGGEHRAFHHIVPREASEVERNRFNAQDMQADRNARRKAKSNTEVNAKRRALYQVSTNFFAINDNNYELMLTHPFHFCQPR